ncbi:MAG: T9SS type A sorting domain-containing protein [Bacteroidota bacterium]
MKQYVYLFIGISALFLSAFSSLHAQCTPDPDLPDGTIIDPLPESEMFPDAGIQDTACVNTDYSTVLTFVAPQSVVVQLLGEVPIDSIVVTEEGVTGLPTGLSFSCNPGNCVFYPDSVGCIGIDGIPAAGTEGTYDLGISVTVFSGILSLDYTLPDETLAPGNYFLNVREEGSAACDPSSIVEGTSAGLSLQLAPNPAATYTELMVQSEQARLTEVRLYNTTGQLVQSAVWQLIPGGNRYRLETSDLPLGLYTAVLTDGRQGVSTRLLVQR